MAQLLFVGGVALASYGMSLLITVMSANSTGAHAVAFGVTAGPYLFVGLLGSAVTMALRSQHDRIKLLEQSKSDGAAKPVTG